MLWNSSRSPTNVASAEGSFLFRWLLFFFRLLPRGPFRLATKAQSEAGRAVKEMFDRDFGKASPNHHARP
jgi:hypothetical protein